MTTRQALLVPLLVVAGSTAGMAQRPVTDAELIAGPWEVSGPAWTEGVFFSINTQVNGRRQRPTIRSQTIQVRAYHRRDGREHWQWFVLSPDESNSRAFFDGRRLRVRGDLLTLDVVFDPDHRRWSGTWNRDGQVAPVTLERPHPPSSAAPSPFCGRWQGTLEIPGASLVLHIAQSADGALSAWLDRVVDVADQRRHGQRYQVVADQRSITLAIDSPSASPWASYTGTLTSDGTTIIGDWHAPPPDRGTALFHKVDANDCRAN